MFNTVLSLWEVFSGLIFFWGNIVRLLMKIDFFLFSNHLPLSFSMRSPLEDCTNTGYSQPCFLTVPDALGAKSATVCGKPH